MKRVKQMDEYECDGCGRRWVVDKDQEPPEGYHGRVLHIAGAGTGGDWYACTSRCIRKAVLRSLEIALMDPDEYAELERS